MCRSLKFIAEASHLDLVLFCPKCKKGFAVTPFADLNPVYGKFYLIVTVKFDHCLRKRNDGGSPHEDGSFIFVTETGLHAIKGKHWDFMESIPLNSNVCLLSHAILFL